MRTVLFCLVTIFFIFSSAPAQELGAKDSSSYPITRALEYLPPLVERALIIEIGAGFGAQYGMFGGKLAFGDALASGDLGLGIIPIAWEPSVAFGGSVHLASRYSAVNPRFTVQYTSTAAYNILVKETMNYTSSSTSVFYKEGFPGISIMGGLDIRFGKIDHLTLGLYLGAGFPFAGMDEVEKRYNAKKAQLIQQGYTMESESTSFSVFPRISVGINYVWGRSLELR